MNFEAADLLYKRVISYLCSFAVMFLLSVWKNNTFVVEKLKQLKKLLKKLANFTLLSLANLFDLAQHTSKWKCVFICLNYFVIYSFLKDKTKFISTVLLATAKNFPQRFYLIISQVVCKHIHVYELLSPQSGDRELSIPWIRETETLNPREIHHAMVSQGPSTFTSQHSMIKN